MSDSDVFKYIPYNQSPIPVEGRFSGVASFLSVGLNFLLGVVCVVNVIGLILAGIKFMSSKGDPKAADAAKHALTMSIIGVVLSAGAFAVKTLFFKLWGVQLDDVPGF